MNQRIKDILVLIIEPLWNLVEAVLAHEEFLGLVLLSLADPKIKSFAVDVFEPLFYHTPEKPTDRFDNLISLFFLSF